jgi:hypothetical protein
MNKTNKILAFFLVVQIVLLAARALWPESESKASGEALLADFDPAAITQVRISDSAGEELVLKKDGENWILPDHGNYPVQGMTVSLLLDKIKGLKTDRLITRSTTSHRRLKVSSDEFERLLELQTGDTTHKLYLGTTSGGNTIHVRLDDQDPVYLVSNLSNQDANPRSSSWIDTVYFSVPSDQVTSLRLQNANGDFEFTKEGDTWTMTGLAADENLNQDTLTRLLSQITSFHMIDPIGTELQDTFGLDAPQATITVHAMVPEQTSEPTSETPLLPLLTPSAEAPSPEPSTTPQLVEKEYTLQFGAALEDGVVVKSSESEYYVLVTTGSADNFAKKTRADFIAVPPTPTPEPTLGLGEATEEPFLSTPEASATPRPATPEAAVTPESGAVATEASSGS